ncbi:PAS domain S-box protein [Patescibacteria group bacterium]
MENNEIQEKNNGLFENFPVYIFEVSKEGKLTDASKATSEFFGYEEGKIIGLDLKKMLGEESKEILKELAETGHIENREMTVEIEKGESKKVLVNADVVKNQKDEESHFVFVLVDMTKVEEFEKEREGYLYFLESIGKINEAIQKATDIKQMMTDVLNTVMSVLKCDRAWFVYPCDPASEFWSVPMAVHKPEYPGLTPADNIPMVPMAQKIMKAVLDTKGPVAYDPATKRELDDEARKVSVKSQLLMAMYPKINKPWVFGIHQCDYARIWSEEDMMLFEEIGYRVTDALTSSIFLDQLKEGEEKFKSLIETTPVLIVHLDPELKILEWNKEAEKLYGEKRENVLGKDYSELFLPEEARGPVAKEISEILSGKLTKGFENDVVDKSGGVHNMSWNSVRILGSDGEPTGIIAVGQDITERKKAEQTLKEKIGELERMNKMMVGRELKMVELKEKLAETKE